MTETNEPESTIACPECKHAFSVGVFSSIPASQKLRVELTSETTLFAADGIAEMIEHTSKLLKSVAKECGEKVTVFLGDVKVIPNKVQLEFIIATNKKHEACQ